MRSCFIQTWIHAIWNSHVTLLITLLLLSSPAEAPRLFIHWHHPSCRASAYIVDFCLATYQDRKETHLVSGAYRRTSYTVVAGSEGACTRAIASAE